MTRKNYVTHIKALKLSMKYRLKLKKIHRVIEFDPGSLVEAVHRYEYGLKNKSQRWF